MSKHAVLGVICRDDNKISVSSFGLGMLTWRPPLLGVPPCGGERTL